MLSATLTTLKNTLVSGLQKLQASLSVPEENPLPSIEEPYIEASATSEQSVNMAGGETLREKAAKKLHGPDANPSQLGDPISLKAETSKTIPRPDGAGAGQSNSTSNNNNNNNNNTSSSTREEDGHKLRVKAAKKTCGPDANPSMLGDPVSLKNEASVNMPTDEEREAAAAGARRRDSKL